MSFQLKRQKSYFNKTWKRLNKYKLLSWQRHYISRIRKDMFRRNYKNATLIDIGAGGGFVSVEMAKMGLKVIALELSEQSIHNLRKHKKKFSLKNLKLILGSAEKISLPDKSVDYIVSSAVLEHILEEKKAINEWIRILKPKGRMFVTVPLKYRYLWPFFWPVNYIHDKTVGHLRRYDLGDLERKFNLKTMKVYYTGHFLKMVWFFISIFVKCERGDRMVEKYDSKLVNKIYGASNISVIFEKPAKNISK